MAFIDLFSLSIYYKKMKARIQAAFNEGWGSRPLIMICPLMSMTNGSTRTVGGYDLAEQGICHHPY